MVIEHDARRKSIEQYSELTRRDRPDYIAAACEGDAELRNKVDLLLGFESSTEEIGNPTAPAGFTGAFHEAPTVALSYEPGTVKRV